MKKAKIELEIIKTDSGKIRLKFPDGGNYLLPDTLENMYLFVAFDLELTDTLKKQRLNEDTDTGDVVG